MAIDWEKYSFYKILGIEPDAGADEIMEAHKSVVSSLDPGAGPEEEKKAAALALIAAEAALETLSDEESRKAYDSKLDNVQNAASEKKKIEGKRKGKLQEQQSIEDDEKLQKATARLDSAASAIIDYYYDRLFKKAREGIIETIAGEDLMEWLSSERAEAARASQPKSRGTSFIVDWRGFMSVQDRRKDRGEGVIVVVEKLLRRFQLS